MFTQRSKQGGSGHGFLMLWNTMLESFDKVYLLYTDSLNLKGMGLGYSTLRDLQTEKTSSYLTTKLAESSDSQYPITKPPIGRFTTFSKPARSPHHTPDEG